MDTGLGKTVVSLQLIDDFYFQKGYKATLIVAPLHIINDVWPSEIAKFDRFSTLSFQILHGKGKENLKPKKDIYLVNSENCIWLFDMLQNKNFKWPFDTLIIDESTEFKSPKTKRFKKLKKIRTGFKRIYLLSGTPQPNGLMDLWSQIFILDGGKRLGKYITHYREKYFRNTAPRHVSWSRWEIKNKRAAEKILSKIADISITLDKKTNLPDLPPKIRNIVQISLPKKIQKIYDAIEKKSFAEINERDFLLDSSSGYQALRQIVGGHIYEPLKKFVKSGRKKRIFLKLHEAKIDRCKSIINELNGDPCLIAYYYHPELALLKKTFGNPPYLGSKQKNMSDIIREWNKGNLPIVLCQPQSIALGLNLQYGGNHMIWYSLIGSFLRAIQFEDRLHRNGQKKNTFIHYLICKNTVEEAILERLEDGEKGHKNFMDYIKDYWRKKEIENV